MLSFRNLFSKTYHPLNEITVSKEALLSNYQYLCSINSGIKIAPVLKSNAYGHGLKNVAQVLDSLRAPFFCVDSLYEAYELFKIGIKTKILIMGFSDPRNLGVKKLPFSYVVFDLAQLEGIYRNQPNAGIHLFIDTGMHREGISLDDLSVLCANLKKFPRLNLEGLMSHLALPESTDDKRTRQQIEDFKTACGLFVKEGLNPKWIHINASSGLLRSKVFKAFSLGNVARAGLSLYGFDPKGEDPVLKPILKLKTKIIQVKKLRKGESLGYDFTFTAKTDMVIGILPLGYFDGVGRRLSNKGFVLVGGQACPIVGLISMNITTLDLSKVTDPKIGQEAIVLSDDPHGINCVANSAKLSNTIPHDILIHLNPSIRRELV